MSKYLLFIAAISGTIFYFFGVSSEKFSASYPYPAGIVYDNLNRDFIPRSALIAEGKPSDVVITQEGDRNKGRIFRIMAEGEEIGVIDLQFVPRDDGRRSDVVGSIRPAMVNGTSVKLKDARAIATALDIRLGNYNRLAMKAQAEGYESIEAMVYGNSLGAKMAFGDDGAKKWGNSVAGMMDGMRASEEEARQRKWAGKDTYNNLELKTQMRDAVVEGRR